MTIFWIIIALIILAQYHATTVSTFTLHCFFSPAHLLSWFISPKNRFNFFCENERFSKCWYKTIPTKWKLTYFPEFSNGKKWILYYFFSHIFCALKIMQNICAFIFCIFFLSCQRYQTGMTELHDMTLSQSL